MENLETIEIIENMISYIIMTIFLIIIGIKILNIWKETKQKDIELKEEIKNYYRRKQ